MAKDYVEFYFPGVSLEGQKEKEVSSRNANLSGLIPDGAIFYRFFSRNSNTEKTDYSPRHFIADAQYSVEEFKAKFPQLCNDPEFAKAHFIIRAVTGGFYALNETDLVVTL